MNLTADNCCQSSCWLGRNQARGEQAGPTFAHADAFLGAHIRTSFVAQNPDIFGKGDQYFNKWSHWVNRRSDQVNFDHDQLPSPAVITPPMKKLNTFIKFLQICKIKYVKQKGPPKLH